MLKRSRFSTRLTAALLAAVMALSMAACGKDNEESSSSSSSSDSSSSESSSSSSSKPEKEKPVKLDPIAPEKAALDKLNEKVAINGDVVGWLTVPDTEIDEEILHKPVSPDYNPQKEGEFYERRNINQQYEWYGSYFADYDARFGQDRNDLSNVTTIYGHSMDDNPDSLKFSKLKRYVEKEFAEQHPEIQFTLPEDQTTWKVFSASYVNTDLPFYYPNLSGPELDGLIQGLKDYSLYDYDIEVKNTDKVMILSTCTYLFGSTPKEHEKYRFLVAARLVRPGESTGETVAKLVPNEDRKKPNE